MSLGSDRGLLLCTQIEPSSRMRRHGQLEENVSRQSHRLLGAHSPTLPLVGSTFLSRSFWSLVRSSDYRSLWLHRRALSASPNKRAHREVASVTSGAMPAFARGSTGYGRLWKRDRRLRRIRYRFAPLVPAHFNRLQRCVWRGQHSLSRLSFRLTMSLRAAPSAVVSSRKTSSERGE